MRSLSPARSLALLFVFALGCGGRLVPLTPQSAVLLPQAQQTDLVRGAIARALTARRFVAEAEQPGTIVARYERRGQQLRVQIDYTGTQYQITYLDSVGFGHQVDRAGQTVISSHYPRQVRALSSSIDEEIARPAREAQEAAERERNHQLELARQETERQQAVLDAQQRERDADRNAQLEAERLRTERARAEADANRPVIVQQGGQVVGALAFEQNARVRPGYGTLRVRGGHINVGEDGYAGGPMHAQALNFPSYCTGYFADSPSHVLRVDRARPIRIEVSANMDTTLAVVTSDGSIWCDDDSAGGLNPRIEGEFPQGTYYVWVGAYNAGESAPYHLSMVEYSVQTPVPQGPVRTPECTQAMIRAGYSGGDLVYCDNVDASCAVAMIDARYSGSDVRYCAGVEPQCAVAMVNARYAGSDIAYCQGVEPGCALAAIERRYSARDIGNCR
jgi:hypothetical protein